MFPNYLSFISGAIAMGFAVAGLYFWRFWMRTRDRLFLGFAVAFWLMMLQAGTALMEIPVEPRSWVFLFRLLAYSVVIAAIVGKNTGWRLRRK
jgi:hypothetical protein